MSVDDIEPGASTATADPPGLRMTVLRRYLAERLDGFDAEAPVDATLLAGGRSNVTYLLTQGVRQWVLRRPPLGHVMPTAHDMAREYRVLSGLARTAVPVPATRLLCEDHDVLGVSFMVMDYVSGRTFGDADDVAGLSAEEAGQISAAAVDALISVHEADIAAAGLSELGRPQGYLTRQASRWRKQWELTRTRDIDGFTELADWVTDKTPAFTDRPFSIVHGDYRLDNLIVGHDQPTVEAILDWEMSTLGDPVSDLALLLVYWTSAQDGLRNRVPVALGVTDGPGFYSRAELMQRYVARHPVDEEHLNVCLALCCLKLAVVMESIHFRALEGTQIGADVSRMGEATPALVQLGLNVIHGGGVAALSG
jgi:aminoglycoside phosphotransferase (APT) family kinase protein